VGTTRPAAWPIPLPSSGPAPCGRANGCGGYSTVPSGTYALQALSTGPPRLLTGRPAAAAAPCARPKCDESYRTGRFAPRLVHEGAEQPAVHQERELAVELARPLKRPRHGNLRHCLPRRQVTISVLALAVPTHARNDHDGPVLGRCQCR
jgi:hypothetical protein